MRRTAGRSAASGWIRGRMDLWSLRGLTGNSWQRWVKNLKRVKTGAKAWWWERAPAMVGSSWAQGSSLPQPAGVRKSTSTSGDSSISYEAMYLVDNIWYEPFNLNCLTAYLSLLWLHRGKSCIWFTSVVLILQVRFSKDSLQWAEHSLHCKTRRKVRRLWPRWFSQNLLTFLKLGNAHKVMQAVGSADWEPIEYYPCDIDVVIWRANIAKMLWIKDRIVFL